MKQEEKKVRNPIDDLPPLLRLAFVDQTVVARAAAEILTRQVRK